MQYPEATVQSQYAASPTIRRLVDGFNEAVDPRNDIKLFYDKIFNPATAQGVGLDYWARIVGVERNIFVEDLTENFGFFVSGTPSAGTYEIPAAVQSLPGYGWSAGDVYNFVDFDRQVYVRRVGGIDLGVLSWHLATSGSLRVFDTVGSEGAALWEAAGGNPKYAATGSEVSNLLCIEYPAVNRDDIARHIKGIATRDSSDVGRVRICDPAKDEMTAAEFKAAMDGVILYYELAEPVETDISAYLSSLPVFLVEPGTALSFQNSNGDDYQIPVPSEISYTVDGEVVTDNAAAYQKTIGGTLGDVTVNKVGGKTIVWNQKINQYSASTAFTNAGLTLTRNADNSATITGTATAQVSGTHTFRENGGAVAVGDICFARLKGNQQISWRIGGTNATTTSVTEYKLQEVTSSSPGYPSIQCTYTNGTTFNETIFPFFVNLTQMFGKGNEPTDAAAVNAMFPENYYTYDAGSLLSAGVTDIEYYNKVAQEWQPWDQGVFFEPGTVKRGAYRIDDNAFRRLVFWKALANISTADCYTLNRLLTKLFDSPVIVTETGVMQIRMTATKALEDWQKAVLMQYGLFGKPCGVGYEFWTIETPVLGFVLDGDNYSPLGQAPFYSGVMQREIGG